MRGEERRGSTSNSDQRLKRGARARAVGVCVAVQEGGLSIENIFQKDGKLCMVLTDIPQVLPFQQRVLIFHRLLEVSSEARLLASTPTHG